MPVLHFPFRILAALLWMLAPLSARAGHPLITEDTDTQGQGKFQLELTSESTTLRERGATRTLGLGTVAFSYGAVDSVDVILAVPYLRLGHSVANGERVDIWHTSAAVVRQIGETLKLIVDTGIDTNTERGAKSDPVFLIAGVIYSPRAHFDIDVGYKLESAESWRARSLLAGVTLRR